MPRLGFAGLGLLAALVASAATARAQAPAANPAEGETKAADEARADDEDPAPKSDQSQPKTEAKSAEVPEAPASSEQAPLPPPGPPRGDEQAPRPFLLDVAPLGRDRHIEVGADVGVWSRPAKGDQVSYSPGVAWGVHARSELTGFLALSAYFNRSRHAVDVPYGGLGLPDTNVEQEPLEVLQLGARLEPSLKPTPELRLWLGLGVAWGHVSAEEPTTSGAGSVEYADRTGIFLEYSAALGATWDVVPEWLALSLMASGGVLTNQTGDLFANRQAISQSGTRTEIGALPEFESSFTALLGVGMIL